MPIQAPQWTDYLNCPICCREFGASPRSPISLNCGHTFCKHCIRHLHRKQCPFDQAVIQLEPEELVINTALLQLAGFTPPVQPYHPPSIKALSEQDQRSYDTIIKCMEHLAIYLKFSSTANNSEIGSRLSRPMQRKLVTLLQCPITDEDGRGKAARAARSLGERTVTELILQHQNPQQLSANLWAAVRARGCQFLGPAMQEEVLKLVLLALEDGSALSRKVLVMFVVQRLEPHFPQASKTSIGHVVQLLYRASCFKVSKRESDSSLMQLKEEFRTYESLRREHDAQIVQIATEAGLRIAPDQWSALLYGDTTHKSHMQSVIDKLQSPQSFAQSVQELFIALQRSGDPAKLVVISMHLDRLSNIDSSPDAKCPSWQKLAEIMTSLKEVVSGLVNYLQQQSTVRDANHKKYNIDPTTNKQRVHHRMVVYCPYLDDFGICQRSLEAPCPYYHVIKMPSIFGAVHRQEDNMYIRNSIQNEPFCVTGSQNMNMAGNMAQMPPSPAMPSMSPQMMSSGMPLMNTADYTYNMLPANMQIGGMPLPLYQHPGQHIAADVPNSPYYISMPGTQGSMPGAQAPIQGPQGLMPGAQEPMPGAQEPIPGVQGLITGAQAYPPNFSYNDASVQHQNSLINTPFQNQMMNNPYQSSDMNVTAQNSEVFAQSECELDTPMDEFPNSENNETQNSIFDIFPQNPEPNMQDLDEIYKSYLNPDDIAFKSYRPTENENAEPDNTASQSSFFDTDEGQDLQPYAFTETVEAENVEETQNPWETDMNRFVYKDVFLFTDWKSHINDMETDDYLPFNNSSLPKEDRVVGFRRKTANNQNTFMVKNPCDNKGNNCVVNNNGCTSASGNDGATGSGNASGNEGAAGSSNASGIEGATGSSNASGNDGPTGAGAGNTNDNDDCISNSVMPPDYLIGHEGELHDELFALEEFMKHEYDFDD